MLTIVKVKGIVIATWLRRETQSQKGNSEKIPRWFDLYHRKASLQAGKINPGMAPCPQTPSIWGSGGMVDAGDLKSPGREVVWVRVPSPLPKLTDGSFFDKAERRLTFRTDEYDLALSFNGKTPVSKTVIPSEGVILVRIQAGLPFKNEFEFSILNINKFYLYLE